MAPDICAEFAYDVSRPEDADRIRAVDKTHFEVHMASDPGHPDVRPDLCFHNRTGCAVECTLDIVWCDERWAIYCDYLFVRPLRRRDWHMLSSRADGATTRTVLELAPGRTLVAFCPVYTYGDCLAFAERMRRCKDDAVSVTAAGRSHEGREIPLVTVSRGGSKANCLVVSRCHGYETAGCFCVEGMLRFLREGGQVAQFFLDRYAFHFIPTMNVDAVANGDSRLTRPGGADLNRDIDCNRAQNPGSETDEALLAHFRTIDALKPDLYLNLHNWTGKFDDGLIGWDQEEVDVFRSFMPDQIEDFKRWRASVTIVPGNRSPGRYCRETYDTIGFVLEFPWYGRIAERMRVIGATALKALVHTGLHLRKHRQLAAMSKG